MWLSTLAPFKAQLQAIKLLSCRMNCLLNNRVPHHLCRLSSGPFHLVSSVGQVTEEADTMLIILLLPIKLLGLLSPYGLKMSACLKPRLLLGLHWSSISLCSLLLPISPLHRCWSKGHSLRRILHTKLHLRVCFPENPTGHTNPVFQRKEGEQYYVVLFLYLLGCQKKLCLLF